MATVTKKREYKCKYDCGFTRSRKAVVIEHEKTCNHRIVDRLKDECQQLRDVNNETNKIIEDLKKQLNGFQNQIDALQNQVSGLMRRRKREENDEAIHNFRWNKELRFDRDVFERVMKRATSAQLAMDVFVVEVLENLPVFYKLKRQKNKLDIKGVIGVINRQPIGTDNVFTTMTFNQFYTAIMDTLLDEFYEYHNTVAMEKDELLPVGERESEEDREERLNKTFNLRHYRSIANDASHNQLYRACKNRVISLMYATMAKKIKGEKVLTL